MYDIKDANTIEEVKSSFLCGQWLSCYQIKIDYDNYYSLDKEKPEGDIKREKKSKQS
jgi:hypothetical protein